MYLCVISAQPLSEIIWEIIQRINPRLVLDVNPDYNDYFLLMDLRCSIYRLHGAYSSHSMNFARK